MKTNTVFRSITYHSNSFINLMSRINNRTSNNSSSAGTHLAGGGFMESTPIRHFLTMYACFFFFFYLIIKSCNLYFVTFGNEPSPKQNHGYVPIYISGGFDGYFDENE